MALEDDGPEASKLGPLRGTAGRQSARPSGRRDHRVRWLDGVRLPPRDLVVLWLKVEPFKDVFPYGLLTMIVSLEAIFLSTFVMMSQNRADVKRQVLADPVGDDQAEERQNQQLLDLSTRLMTLTTEIHALTTEVHQLVRRRTA
jgi:Protein of unknown function (DUF1003)